MRKILKQKQLLIILGTLGAAVLLILYIIFPLIKNLYLSNYNSDNIIDITLCDLDARDLCIVTFGTDISGRMIINFQLPGADYPAFYVHGANRETDNTYKCETAKAVPTTVYCTGMRTPLGEAIDIKVFATENNLLIARGKIVVSAMIFSTPVNLSTIPEGKTITPSVVASNQINITLSPAATIHVDATPTVRYTSTPDAAYPYP